MLKKLVPMLTALALSSNTEALPITRTSTIPIIEKSSPDAAINYFRNFAKTSTIEDLFLYSKESGKIWDVGFAETSTTVYYNRPVASYIKLANRLDLLRDSSDYAAFEYWLVHNHPSEPSGLYEALLLRKAAAEAELEKTKRKRPADQGEARINYEKKIYQLEQGVQYLDTILPLYHPEFANISSVLPSKLDIELFLTSSLYERKDSIIPDKNKFLIFGAAGRMSCRIGHVKNGEDLFELVETYLVNLTQLSLDIKDKGPKNADFLFRNFSLNLYLASDGRIDLEYEKY